MPDLKLYTIADLRSWLIDNNPPAGLSEHVIAPVRAYAILNNPYVKDEDAVVAAIYEGDELAAFTAAFPDMHEGKRIWWASTLWCNPKFQGKGYGLIIIGSLMEAHEGEVTLDRWGAQETVEIFKCLGYETIYTPRYIFGDKAINRSTLKGKLAYCIQKLKKSLYSSLNTLQTSPYTLKYNTFIDGEAYAFIKLHRDDDLFLREQQMLNWILQYPFMQSCVVFNKVKLDTKFTSNVSTYLYRVVKVFCSNTLYGIYVLRKKGDHLGVVYLYYDSSKKDIVFASIIEHVVRLKTIVFESENVDLVGYVKRYLYCSMDLNIQVSFSYPNCMKVAYDGDTSHWKNSLQLGDGDSFA